MLNMDIKIFYIALGYKSNVVKKYFKNFKLLNKKFNFSTKKINCSITLIDTGKNTLTGGRLKRTKKFINKNEKLYVHIWRWNFKY